MRVLLLSPYPSNLTDPIVEACHAAGDEMSDDEPDIAILWGYRHILQPHELLGRRTINIHTSFLPWNRGASPNLWSWYDDTPKGVSIHEVTEEIDAGPILCQRDLGFMLNEDGDTLRTSYNMLTRGALDLFKAAWPFICENKFTPISNEGGSIHTVIESSDLMKHFPMGWDTPVRDIAEFGREQRRNVL